MTAPILVTGGTGNLGGRVVDRLRAAGHPVRVLSRSAQETADWVEPVTGDLATGDGVDAALAGVRTIVHCAGNAKGDQVLARTLVRAARPAGVTHLVNISVVGADRVPVRSRLDQAMFGYFAAKLGAEQVIASSGLPFTTLRATQFHDLVLTTVQQLTKLPVVPVPTLRFQPVEVDEVAARLVELAVGPPAGLVAELGGPRVYPLSDLVRSYLRATHRHRPILPVRPLGGAARALRAGANLVAGAGVGRTWEAFLAESIGGAVHRQ